MKPMLASDLVIEKLRFPLIIQPKIDGVRALNIAGTLTGRSLKQHANRYATEFFSHPRLTNLDGEMAAEVHTHPDLCSLTSSALSTIKGEPDLVWWLFDCLDQPNAPYVERLIHLEERVAEVGEAHPFLRRHLRIIPSTHCATLEHLLRVEADYLSRGYEGLITRDPFGKHKQGRSTVREGGLLRLKRFVDAEAEVIGVLEGEANDNPAQINELGLQYRTSHQSGKVPNGQVGALLCRTLSSVTVRGVEVLKQGQEITVSPGKMSLPERQYWFARQRELRGRIVKFKFFPRGVKDKPRFPTFQSFRAGADLGRHEEETE